MVRSLKTLIVSILIISISTFAFGAEFYVSASATGGGVGSSGDPFTIVEGYAKADYNNNDKCWIKEGAYVIAARLLPAQSAIQFIGYSSSIGDCNAVWGETNKPVISVAGDIGTELLEENGKRNIFSNLVFDGANNGAYDNIITDANNWFYNCVSKNSGKDGVDGGNYIACIVDSADVEAFTNCAVYYCLAKNSGGTGFVTTTGNAWCVSYNNGGFGWYSAVWLVPLNCSAIDNGDYGFYVNGGVFINCISTNHAIAGYYAANVPAGSVIRSVSYGDGSTSNLYEIDMNTEDPQFGDPSSDDFSIGNSNLYGYGGYVGSLDGTGTQDLGAVQKSSGVGVASGGGGGGFFYMD